MIKEINEKLLQIIDKNSFLRVDATHPLDLYVGVDEFGQTTFLIVSKSNASILKSSSLIDIKLERRTDKRYNISLSLKDDNYKDIFTYFISEIIDASRRYTPDNGYGLLIKRIQKWQALLSKVKPGILSNSEIKGLIGELIILDVVVASEKNYEYAIKGWIGSEGAKQDFVFESSWIEVKSTNTNSSSVTISSIEQMDTSLNGQLIIINLDKSSELDTLAINLNSIVEKITAQIDSSEVLELFQTMLIKRGYSYNQEYDNIRFKVGTIRKYQVDSTFPCVRRANLPISVIDCKYELSLISIIDKQIGGQINGI